MDNIRSHFPTRHRTVSPPTPSTGLLSPPSLSFGASIGHSPTNTQNRPGRISPSQGSLTLSFHHTPTHSVPNAQLLGSVNPQIRTQPLGAGVQVVAPQSAGAVMPVMTLREAIGRNDLWRVCELVNGGENVNERDRVGGWTAMHWGCFVGNIDIVRYLHSKAASVHVLDAMGESPLHQAAREGHKDIVLFLVAEAGARTDVISADGNTPYDVAKKKEIRLILQASELGADPLLLKALGTGSLRVGKTHIEAAQEGTGSTILLRCSEIGSFDLVVQLVNLGADFNRRDFTGKTPLILASKNGHEMVVEWLLKHGADPKLVDNFGLSAFHHAVNNGHFSIVKMLRYVYPDAINSRDGLNRVPLHYAAYNGYRDVGVFLLESGAEPNVQDDEGRSPLFCAASNGRNILVRLLMDYDANIDEVDNMGRNALIQCAYNGHYLCTRCLLEAGAYANAADQKGMTALHHAATFGHTDILSLLFDFGGSLEIKDLRGYTPLHCAMANGRKETVMILVKSGADIEAMSLDGRTPADCTRNRGMVKLLLSNFDLKMTSPRGDELRSRNSNSCPTNISQFMSEESFDPERNENLDMKVPILQYGTASVLGGLPIQSPHTSLSRTPSANLGSTQGRRKGRSKVFFKIIVLGDSGYIFKQVGVPIQSYMSKQAFVQDNVLTLQIWEGPTNPKDQKNMFSSFASAADCCILVFDVTNPSSFENLDYWRDGILARSKSVLPFILVGNKADLISKNQSNTKMNQHVIESWCRLRGRIPYFPLCSLENKEVDTLFNAAALCAYQSHERLL